MSSVVKRTLAGGSLALAVVVLALADRAVGGGYVVFGTALVLALGSAIELGRMGTLRAFALVRPLAAGALVAGAGAFVLRELDFAPDLVERMGLLLELVGLACIGALVVRVVDGIVRARSATRAPAWMTALFAAWVGPPLLLLPAIAARGGTSELVAFVLISKLGDTAGYFVGRSIGKSHPFPQLSPGKTTAGCIASLVAGTLAGAALVATDVLAAPSLGLLGGALLGAVVNVAAQAGDLLESRVKRFAGVKDSSALFGPSGGMLDVVDSLLLTAPVWFVLAPTLLG